MIVRELSPVREQLPLGARTSRRWFERTGVVGIEGIDTRRLTRRLRDRAARCPACSPRSTSTSGASRRRRGPRPSMDGQDLVAARHLRAALRRGARAGPPGGCAIRAATRPTGPGTPCTGSWRWTSASSATSCARSWPTASRRPSCRPRTTAEEILALEPDGVFLSNGPGDPAAVDLRDRDDPRPARARCRSSGSASATRSSALAGGARTYKLKFGHRGANHPVRDHATGAIEITSQNHGFVVDADSLARHGRSGRRTRT